MSAIEATPVTDAWMDLAKGMKVRLDLGRPTISTLSSSASATSAQRFRPAKRRYRLQPAAMSKSWASTRRVAATGGANTGSGRK